MVHTQSAEAQPPQQNEHMKNPSAHTQIRKTKFSVLVSCWEETAGTASALLGITSNSLKQSTGGMSNSLSKDIPSFGVLAMVKSTV